MKIKSSKGFTVTELAIVIAVIAILVAVLVPTFVNLIDKANESAALQNASTTYTQMSLTAAVGGTTIPDNTVIKSGNYYYKLIDGILTLDDTVPTTASTKLENGLDAYYPQTAISIVTVSSDKKIKVTAISPVTFASAKVTVKNADGEVVIDSQDYADNNIAFDHSGWFTYIITDGSNTYTGVFFN